MYMRYDHICINFVEFFKLYAIFPIAIISLDDGVKIINYGLDLCLGFWGTYSK